MIFVSLMQRDRKLKSYVFLLCKNKRTYINIVSDVMYYFLRLESWPTVNWSEHEPKSSTKAENSTTHVTYLPFLYIDLFIRCLKQKRDPLSSEAGGKIHFSDFPGAPNYRFLNIVMPPKYFKALHIRRYVKNPKGRNIIR